MALLEARLKHKADVKLPLRRRCQDGSKIFGISSWHLALPAPEGTVRAVGAPAPQLLRAVPGGLLLPGFASFSAGDPVLFCSARANGSEFLWLTLGSTEEQKLVLEKSVRRNSKGRFLKNISKPQLCRTSERSPNNAQAAFFYFFSMLDARDQPVCLCFVIATKHHANVYFHFLIGEGGGEERGFFFICLYLIYGFTLDTGECC